MKVERYEIHTCILAVFSPDACDIKACKAHLDLHLIRTYIFIMSRNVLEQSVEGTVTADILGWLLEKS